MQRVFERNNINKEMLIGASAMSFTNIVTIFVPSASMADVESSGTYKYIIIKNKEFFNFSICK